jgi:hypothetical protein
MAAGSKLQRQRRQMGGLASAGLDVTRQNHRATDCSWALYSGHWKVQYRGAAVTSSLTWCCLTVARNASSVGTGGLVQQTVTGVGFVT